MRRIAPSLPSAPPTSPPTSDTSAWKLPGELWPRNRIGWTAKRRPIVPPGPEPIRARRLDSVAAWPCRELGKVMISGMSQHHIDRVWDIIEKIGVCMLTTQFDGGLRARPLEARPD